MVDYRNYIRSDPEIMLGKPTIVGTRITVEQLLWKLASGYTFDEVLEMYPNLKSNHILASIAYAAAILESEEVIV